MLLEHLLFTVAIVILIGIYFTRLTGQPYLWILIIFASLIPDIDHLNNIGWKYLGVPLSVRILPFISLGDFHNILWLVIFAAVVAVILELNKTAYIVPAFLFFAFGYGLHLVEDFIAYPPVYAFLYPLSGTIFGINIIPETKDLYVAGTGVLNAGGVLLLVSLCIYTLDLIRRDNSMVNEESE